MSDRGDVYYNDVLAGSLERIEGGYRFSYDGEYFKNPHLPSIALSLPKTQQVYESKELFPFFFGLLSEGVIKNHQCKVLKIDERDHFTRLLKTSGTDTIGAITVKEKHEV